MRRRAAALLLVAPLAFAACGGGKKSSTGPKLTPAASVKQAALKTSESSSQHMLLKGVVTASGQAVSVSGDGDFTKSGGSFRLNFNVGGLGGRIDAVLDGTTLYVRSPLLTASLPQGKTWLRLDLAKAAASQGLDLPSLAAQSPARTLELLTKLSSVKELGAQQLAGTDTTHYRGRLSQDAGGAAAGLYDVWVGDDGYVHRIRHATAAGATVKIATTMDLSDFGKSVKISVPTDAESFTTTTLNIPGFGG